MADVAVTLQPGQQFPVSVTDQLTTVGTAAPLTNIEVSIASVAGINVTVLGSQVPSVTLAMAGVPGPPGLPGPQGPGGGTTSLSGDFTVNLASGVTLGSYSNGSTIPSGTSLLSVVENMLTTVIPATYSSPDCYVSATGSTTVEFGSAISSTIWLNFSQNDAGVATAYSIKLDGAKVVASSSYAFTVSSLTVSRTFSGSVTYARGPQKQNNLGQNSGTPISAGTVYSYTGPTFTPVRAMFYAASPATSAPTTSAAIRALGSPDISGSASFSVSAATGSTGLTIALPDGRTLSQVSFTQNGVTLPVPVANFATSTVSVAGANSSTAANCTVYFLTILGGLGSAGTFNISTN